MPEKPKPPIAGYVRSGVTHIGCEWKFEVMDEKERVAIVDIETEDGPVSVGLNRQDAKNLLRTLTLLDRKSTRLNSSH